MRARALIINDLGQILIGLNYNNEYMLPGGKVEKDEHVADALLRELYEEIGLEEKDIEGLDYEFTHLGNEVFTVMPQASFKWTTDNDPENEFKELEWFDVDALPDNLNEYTEDIIYRFLRGALKDNSLKIEAGHIDVLVDGVKVYELRDDTIWETLPRLAQERAKGKKVTFQQILDDGTVLDQTPKAMPEALAAASKVYFLQYPVSVKGNDDYHITFKYFSKDGDFDLLDIVDNLQGYDLSPPKNIEIIPEVLVSNENNKSYVLKVLNVSDDIYRGQKSLDIFEPHHYDEYIPHITIDKDLWDHISDNSILVDDLDICIGPLEIRYNNKVVYTWGDQQEVVAAAIDTYFDINNAPQIEDHSSCPGDAMKSLQYNIYVDDNFFTQFDSVNDEFDLVKDDIKELKKLGCDVSYKQVLDDGSEVDITPEVLPDYMVVGSTERAKIMQKIYTMINDLLNTYMPEEKNRPTVELCHKVDYFGKTSWKKLKNGENQTHILINSNIVYDDHVLRQVLAHEVIHHHLYQKYGNKAAKHGELFHMIADKMNEKEGENFVTQFANDTVFRENAD